MYRHTHHNLTQAIRRPDLARKVESLRRKLLRIGRRETHDKVEWGAGFSDVIMLGIEAQRVVRLRLAAIAQGGTTVGPEMRLMVLEKILALAEAARMLAGGRSLRAVLLFYRSKVQANERRLTVRTKRPLVDRARQKLSLILVLASVRARIARRRVPLLRS
jgi:hypothetical protein